MPLRHRIPLVLLFVLTCYAILSYTILCALVFPSYLSLEKNEAQKTIMRCMESLGREIHHLDTVTHDWAAWNDMYSFLVRQDAAFIASNLLPEAFTDSRMDLICIFDKEQKPVWGEIRDRDSGTRIDLPELFPVPGKGAGIFFRHTSPDLSTAGIFMTKRGPMLIASRAITTSDHRAPSRGHLLMGRFLNEELMVSIREQSQTPLKIFSLPLEEGLPYINPLIHRFPEENALVRASPDGRLLETYALYPDISGAPALLFESTLARDIRSKGIGTLRLAFFSTWILVVVVIATLLVLLHRMVISPLTRLTRLVSTVNREAGEVPPRATGRRDEIEILEAEFRNMIGRVQKGHLRLAETNERLKEEIAGRCRTEGELRRYQERLRRMSGELVLTEERERRRIAKDLHDRVGQNLALVQIRLDSLTRSRTCCCPVLDSLAEVSGFTEQIIEDTRTLMFDISPPVLYEVGLTAALEWLADDLSAKYDMGFHVSEEEGELPDLAVALRVPVYRGIRELLYNAAKHSNGKNVWVFIGGDASGLRVHVKDDGRGFGELPQENASRHKGLGLFSVRESIEALGGEFSMDPASAGGARVTLVIPLGNGDAS